jgi:hypothetical protein
MKGVIMNHPNPYKTAPTWLVNADGDSKLFMTQREVDEAWNEGWFGPRGLLDNVVLVSSRTYEFKNDLRRDLAADPRYLLLDLNYKKSIREMMECVREFEEENHLDSTPAPKE